MLILSFSSTPFIFPIVLFPSRMPLAPAPLIRALPPLLDSHLCERSHRVEKADANEKVPLPYKAHDVIDAFLVAMDLAHCGWSYKSIRWWEIASFYFGLSGRKEQFIR